MILICGSSSCFFLLFVFGHFVSKTVQVCRASVLFVRSIHVKTLKVPAEDLRLLILIVVVASVMTLIAPRDCLLFNNIEDEPTELLLCSCKFSGTIVGSTVQTGGGGIANVLVYFGVLTLWLSLLEPSFGSFRKQWRKLQLNRNRRRIKH